MAERVKEPEKTGVWGAPVKVKSRIGRDILGRAIAGFAMLENLVSMKIGAFVKSPDELAQYVNNAKTILKQNLDYTKNRLQLEIEARNKNNPDRQAAAKKQLANLDVINILTETGLEMIGVSSERMAVYRRDAQIKKGIKPEEKTETRAQKLGKKFIEASTKEEKLKELLIAAAKGSDALEDIDYEKIIQEVIAPEIKGVAQKVAESQNMTILYKLFNRLFKQRDLMGQSLDRLASDNDYGEDVVEFYDDYTSAEESVSTLDIQKELTDLYTKCKKDKNMVPFYEKVESLYKEAFAKFNLEVDPRYKSKAESLKGKIQKKATQLEGKQPDAIEKS